jgi:hypothetical protein
LDESHEIEHAVFQQCGSAMVDQVDTFGRTQTIDGISLEIEKVSHLLLGGMVKA